MRELLSKHFDPQEIEPRWYRLWTEGTYFEANAQAPYRPFSIVFPPPNITGSLHMGHALTATIQDILTRWRRMQGNNTLWLPGMDHAGIATQMVVERELREKEGKSRHDIGRAQFIERVWAWKEKNGSRIIEQLKLMGASLDWSRLCFTMDAPRSRAVMEVFVRLYEEGLIYRAERLINWCPRCSTALSDLEVESEVESGELFLFAYPLEGGGEIIVATTRPETMLGDTAVAVHPDDARYRDLIGRKVLHPFVTRSIEVIGDPVLVDPEFGTGAVKVTPAHDFNDLEAGRRNRLASVNILNKDGTINSEGGPFAGLDRFAARKQLVAELEKRGLARETKPHSLPVPRCQRCETIVEPMLSLQWFVKVEPLAKPAIEAVERGDTTFVPSSWQKTYFHWMHNIKDWCISRQLWWGHRIPAWYCPSGHTTVAREAPAACATCQSPLLTQDEDVLDTWFSSALWPFSTLGWPDKTPELRTFYPTTVMETGYDILFFWVARMMMMGLHVMGKVPFRTVMLHSMIVDEKGAKMSKVKGNVIDPADVISQHGADALRFALASLSTPAAQGRPIRLSMKRIEESRHFCTKMWNAARFALMNLDGFDADRFADSLREDPGSADLSLADRWILSRLQRAADTIGRALEEFRLNEAAQAAQAFFWSELCDWYVELVKPALRTEGSEGAESHDAEQNRRRAAQGTLATVLDAAMRLLHPFMPFITEEIWSHLPRPDGSPQSLMITLYPTSDERLIDEDAERQMALVQALVSEVRRLRALYRVHSTVKLELLVATEAAEKREIVDHHQALVCDLSKVERITTVSARPARDASSVVGGFDDVQVVARLSGEIDLAAERARLGKELEKKSQELSSVEQRLNDASFRERAPAEVIEEWTQRATALREELRRLREATSA